MKSSTYIGLNKEYNKEDPKFEVGDHVRKSSYKNIFGKSYIPNWILRLKALKVLFHGHMILVILMVKKLSKSFTKKNCKKQFKQRLELKK